MEEPKIMLQKSDRVLTVLAASIRYTLHKRLNIDLPLSECVDLARTYDLRSALNAVSERLRVHKEWGNEEARVKLAVGEAKLGTDHSTTSDVIRLRKKSFEIFQNRKQTESERQTIISDLKQLNREAKDWINLYAKFLAELTSRYKRTKTHLSAMDLPADELTNALCDLEKIIFDAISEADNFN